MNKIVILICVLLVSSCATIKNKNIPYLTKENSSLLKEEPTLTIFSPKKTIFEDQPVLLFVHGGNWNSGDKRIYHFLARNFAKKGITTVLVGYTLSPEANYDKMAEQVANAFKWTKENIANYNGNPDNIYLNGHSAGAHLIALIATNSKYNVDKKSIKGIILNDAAGLDMKTYFESYPPTNKNDYLATWGNDSESWKDASPIYFVDENTPPIKIYLGKKTYESIKVGTKNFTKELNKYQPDVQPFLVNKKHAGMILQFIYPWNNRYDEMIDFMTE